MSSEIPSVANADAFAGRMLRVTVEKRRQWRDKTTAKLEKAMHNLYYACRHSEELNPLFDKDEFCKGAANVLMLLVDDMVEPDDITPACLSRVMRDFVRRRAEQGVDYGFLTPQHKTEEPRTGAAARRKVGCALGLVKQAIHEWDKAKIRSEEVGSKDLPSLFARHASISRKMRKLEHEMDDLRVDFRVALKQQEGEDAKGGEP